MGPVSFFRKGPKLSVPFLDMSFCDGENVRAGSDFARDQRGIRRLCI